MGEHGQSGDISDPGAYIQSLASTGPQAPPPGAPPLPLPTTGTAQPTGNTAPPDGPIAEAGQNIAQWGNNVAVNVSGAQFATEQFAAASAGGGWEYNPDEMKALITDLQDKLDGKLREMKNDAAHLTGIQPPGQELASEAYVGDANTSGESYQPLLDGSIDFLQSYIEVLMKIDRAYQDQDYAALSALRGEDV